MTKPNKRERLNYYEEPEVIAYIEKHCKQKTSWIRKATSELMKRELSTAKGK